MTIRLTPTQSRLAALALLLLVIGLAIAIIALPTLKLHQHYDDAIDSLRDRLVRYRRVSAMRPAIEQITMEIGKRNPQRYYWKGTTPTLVAADMQGFVTRLIGTNSGKIVSSQPLPFKDEGKASAPAKIGVSVQMTASVVPLQLILYGIESGEPYLFVDQLAVRSNQGRAYKAIPGAQPEFSVQLTVHGYGSPGALRP
jgi:general secretion pathway protein M